MTTWLQVFIHSYTYDGIRRRAGYILLRSIFPTRSSKGGELKERRFFLSLRAASIHQPTAQEGKKIKKKKKKIAPQSSFFFFFNSSHLLSLPFFFTYSCIAGSSSPLPLRFVRCFCIAIIMQLFLPSSTRVELCLPTLQLCYKRSQHFFPFLFLQTNSKSHHGGIRTHGPTLLIVVFKAKMSVVGLILTRQGLFIRRILVSV